MLVDRAKLAEASPESRLPQAARSEVVKLLA
jgi:hypothetical protein